MKRIYVDMDGVLCDYETPFRQDLLSNPTQNFPQSRFGFFLELEPLPDAIESFKKLQERYDVWICTRPSVNNLSSYSEKAYWLRKYFGNDILSKTVMTADKSVVKGDFLIDDQTEWGQANFEGELILFGSKDFPNWKTVMDYFEMPLGKTWQLEYSGQGTLENQMLFLKAAGVDVLDASQFPKILARATNPNIGNLQHFEQWKVQPA